MRGNKIFSLLTVTAIATLAGCAVAPRVTPVGADAYRVSATGTRFDSQAETNYRAFTAANGYCEHMGMRVLFRQSEESGAYSYSPKREDLIFTCMSAADPGYLNAGLRHDGTRSRDPVIALQTPQAPQTP